ncbi:nuclear pore complex subunit [Malassezia cuniculi]|uniref:Nuclear pore protein n=1 Tax=Malassezia cuniculi TaxID=948313 RepID=A0AAF0EQT3_9BASI|nr:nuclear pore complex subunit [Malassezia cuniculi]
MDSYNASGAVAGMSLVDLLQQSRKLVNQLGRDSDLPPIQLGIDQIESQSRKLVSKSARGAHPAADARAHYLLASGGIDAAQLANTIQSTDIANTFEPLQPVYDTDVEGYVRHEHEQVILSLIEESRQQTLADFQHELHRSLHRDWQNQKRRILEELGQHRSEGSESVLSRSVSAAPRESSRGDSSSSMAQMQSRMLRYDSVVQRINEARAGAQPLAVARAFLDTVESFAQEPARKRSLMDAWRIILNLVDEPSGVREREFAQTYLDAHAFHGPQGVSLRQRWIRGARVYLEDQFAEYMEQVITANPLQAQRGGVPSTRATVAAFLRVHLRTAGGAWASGLAPAMDSLSQTPLWAGVYYALRIGRHDDALALLQENQGVLRADSAFPAVFKVWLDGGHVLPRQMREQLMGEYLARFRNAPLDSLDPYQYALYRIVGGFDTSKRFPPALVATTESWLWLQLNLVREGEGESYTLNDLANKIEKYGAAHFDPSGARLLHYFQILLLVGRFERAISHLYANSSMQVDAVHFAICLVYYGLLRVPAADAASQFDIYTSGVDATGAPTAWFDFSKLVQRYTRLFVHTSRRDALQYISLIALNADAPAPIGAEQVQRCHELVRGLVLDARAPGFVELLGDVRADGVRTGGLIEANRNLLHIGDTAEYLDKIVRAAAVQCEQERRTGEAIVLYNLVGEFGTVVAVLNRELGASLMEPVDLKDFEAPVSNAGPATLSAVSSVVTLARAVLVAYEHQLSSVSGSVRVCQTLLGLKKAASQYAAGQLAPALQTLESLQVLPLDAEARKDVVSITRRADEFKEYDENVAKNCADIALMAMTILYKLHQELKSSVHRTGAGALLEYRSQARALMMWAGMLRFRMSNETYSQLTRLDVYVSTSVFANLIH